MYISTRKIHVLIHPTHVTSVREREENIENLRLFSDHVTKPCWSRPRPSEEVSSLVFKGSLRLFFVYSLGFVIDVLLSKCLFKYIVPRHFCTDRFWQIILKSHIHTITALLSYKLKTNYILQLFSHKHLCVISPWKYLRKSKIFVFLGLIAAVYVFLHSWNLCSNKHI